MVLRRWTTRFLERLNEMAAGIRRRETRNMHFRQVKRTPLLHSTEMISIYNGIRSKDQLCFLYVSLFYQLGCSLTTEEIRGLIDKTALFVARNGTDGERKFIENQGQNPKFGFLVGGDYSQYYRSAQL